MLTEAAVAARTAMEENGAKVSVEDALVGLEAAKSQALSEWLSEEATIEAVARKQHKNFARYGQTKRLAAMWDAKEHLRVVADALSEKP